MKYQEGNIIALYSGKTVCVQTVYPETKEYEVFETDDKQKIYRIKESEIFEHLT